MREDGRESDAFSLIGQRFDAPWKEIEAQGYIAPADCVEVRVNLTDSERLAYATAETEEKYRFSRDDRHQAEGDRGARPQASAGEQILVIGQYIDQLRRAGRTPGTRPSSRARPATPSARSSSTRSGTGRSTSSSSPRSPTSRSTCRKPPSPSRSPAPSGRARRRPSDSAASCGPRPTGTRPTSIFFSLSPATPSTRTSRRTASASWPSRGTRTASSTRTSSSPRAEPAGPTAPRLPGCPSPLRGAETSARTNTPQHRGRDHLTARSTDRATRWAARRSPGAAGDAAVRGAVDAGFREAVSACDAVRRCSQLSRRHGATARRAAPANGPRTRQVAVAMRRARHPDAAIPAGPLPPGDAAYGAARRRSLVRP
ncbi:hypothetical protein SALBM217S_01399 [Streptomyces griseoloalbus]